MSKNGKKVDFDVIGIGAGFAGLALIHYLRNAGLSVRIFDRLAHGTAIPARQRTAKAIITASPFPRSCCRNGPGPSAIPAARKRKITCASLPTSAICGLTSS